MADDNSLFDAATAARELGRAATLRQAEAVARRWCPPPPQWAAPAATAAAAGDVVGIWRRAAPDDATFERDIRLDNPLLWANVPRIAARPRGKRVVLIGESCARAWPFDPLFTCAAAMRAYFASVPDGAGVELIDLARAGILPAQLVRLAEQARVLCPDVYVVFAGNNWHVHPDLLDRHELASVLRRSRTWAAAKVLFDDCVRHQVRRWVAELTAAARGIPLVFVLPGENLADRWPATGLCNPLLPAREQVARDERLTQIDLLLASGDVAGAAALAAVVVDMEDGVSVAGWRARGRCALAAAAPADATRLFTEARDCSLYLAEYDWLHGYTARLAEMRESAARAGQVVDLPQQLTEAAGGRPPGRELFIDSCHLTTRGVRIAMAATVAALLPLAGLPPRSRDELLETAIDVDPRAEAQGHFVAATFSAHDAESCRHHVRRALAHAPDIAQLMHLYLRVCLRRLPLALCEELPRLKQLAATYPAVQSLARTRTFHPNVVRLMEIVADCAWATDPDVRRGCEALLRREHAIGARARDLLAYEVVPGFPDLVSRRRLGSAAYRRQQRFDVVADGAPAVRLRLTTRVRHPSCAGRTATLFVNGIGIHHWRVTTTWTTTECVLSEGALSELVNAVTIEWPIPDESRDERLLAVQNTLDAGPSTVDGSWRAHYYGDRAFELVPGLQPIYGEIHAFTAALASVCAAAAGTPAVVATGQQIT